MAQHRIQTHPIILRRVEVARAVDVTPRLRRVTLTGDQLGAFTRDGLSLPAFHSPGFDDHVKLIFAADGDLAAALPRQLADGIEWGPAPNRLGRDYTPRRFDPAAGELDLDFVLHGDGPAASWATAARPGDELWFAGPKSSTVLPDDLDWILLAGDETALPAIGRFLDERPLDVPAQVVVVITDPAAELPLAPRPGDTLRWVRARHADGPDLEQAIRELERWPGTGYAWCAGESRALIPIRRHLTRERGLPKSHLDVTGYWHAEETGPTGPRFAEWRPSDYAGATVGWFAIRAALDLGLLDPLAGGPLELAALAELAGVPADRLTVLVDVLVRAELLATAGTTIKLGRLGELLLDHEHDQEHFTGPDADLIVALTDLAPSLRSGASPWSRRHGQTLQASLDEDQERYAELVEQAGRLQYVITGLARLDCWRDAGHVALTGPGAVLIADRLRADLAGVTTAVVEHPAALAVLAQEPADHDHGFTDDWPATEVAVSVLALGQRTDDEAIELLRELAGAAPRAVIIDALRPDALSPAAAQQSLLGYAGTGLPPRSPERLRSLAAEAGWAPVSDRSLGWGVDLFSFERA